MQGRIGIFERAVQTDSLIYTNVQVSIICTTNVLFVHPFIRRRNGVANSARMVHKWAGFTVKYNVAKALNM